MTNQGRIESKPLIELLDRISQNTDECTLRVVSNMSDAERCAYCKKHKNCRGCLQNWLAEEE